MADHIKLTAYDLASRYVGTEEVLGVIDNPVIMAMLRLDQVWPEGDEVPWCGAFVNWICWHLRLPRSKNLWARSWLNVGYPLMKRNPLDQSNGQQEWPEARCGFDVVVLMRGGPDQPGPEVIDAPGHVGFFAAWGSTRRQVQVLGGNQGNEVNIRTYPTERILGIRRLLQ